VHCLLKVAVASNVKANTFVIRIAAVLLFCYCKWYLMAVVIRILLNIGVFHVSRIILIITHFSILFCFLHT
jgi:hypothetical protein